MMKLFGMIYILVAPTMMGIVVTALLTVDKFEAWWIAGGAVVAALAALPVAWFVSRAILEATRRRA